MHSELPSVEGVIFICLQIFEHRAKLVVIISLLSLFDEVIDEWEEFLGSAHVDAQVVDVLTVVLALWVDRCLVEQVAR